MKGGLFVNVLRFVVKLVIKVLGSDSHNNCDFMIDSFITKLKTNCVYDEKQDKSCSSKQTGQVKLF